MLKRKILFFQHVAWAGGSGGSLCQIVRLICRQYEVHVVLCADGPLRDILEEMGGTVSLEPRIIPFCGAFGGNKSLLLNRENREGLLGYRRTVRIAQEICEKIQPDMVYLNTSVLFPVALGAKRAGVKKVILHIREPLCFAKGSFQEKIKDRVVDSCVDELIAITQGNADDFAGDQPCLIVHNWVDFSGRDGTLDPYAEFGIPSEKKIILVMGGRHRCKGTLVALQAATMLDRDDFILLAVGLNSKASWRKRLLRKGLDWLGIKTYGREMDRLVRVNKTKIIATPPTLKMKSLIDASSMVVFPFTQPHFSKGAIEAGALGKPVIISDTGAYLAGIEDGVSGVVVDLGDTDALAEAMGELLDYPAAGLRLGHNFNQLVEREFSEKDSIPPILSLLLSN